ncbi:hypothetical protein P4233_21550 [Pseudomonas aeruginosa]|nr:hypothetical protein [Pseudomonas aeruginosa]
MLTTFAPTLSTSEAHVRLQLCYPLLFPQRLGAVRVYPLLPAAARVNAAAGAPQPLTTVPPLTCSTWPLT